MMLHHPFKEASLIDLLRDDSGLAFDTWQEAYQYCKNHHSKHESDPLGTTLDVLDDESDTESLSEDKCLNGDEVRHEELLLLRHPRHNVNELLNSDVDFG